MLADTSSPRGSDASLSTVGSLSQELSHRRITLTACPGRIPLVEQRVLSQLTLLRQSVKRLSRRTQIARLEPLHPFSSLWLGTREPEPIDVAHLPAAMPHRHDLERHHALDKQALWGAPSDTRRIEPMGLVEPAHHTVVLRQPSAATFYGQTKCLEPRV